MHAAHRDRRRRVQVARIHITTGARPARARTNPA